MTAQKGRQVLLKLNTTGETFAAIGGAQSVTHTYANTSVDITNSDSAGKRQLLEGAGVSSQSLKLSGVYVDDDYIKAIRDAADNNTHVKMQVVWPGDNGGTAEGMWEITQFELSANYNEAVKDTITLESADVITWTDA